MRSNPDFGKQRLERNCIPWERSQREWADIDGAILLPSATINQVEFCCDTDAHEETTDGFGATEMPFPGEGLFPWQQSKLWQLLLVQAELRYSRTLPADILPVQHSVYSGLVELAAASRLSLETPTSTPPYECHRFW